MKYQIGDKVKTANAGNGVVCHISGGIDYVHVRTEKHGVVFASVTDLTKLPKYSVGDVVRSKSHNQILEVAEVGTTHYRSKEGHYMSENYIEPFDGFRVGDAVFTVKRGKGKIASKHITKGGHESWKKPFWVHFDDGNETTPKKENLIPTEAKYKEALNKTGYAFKIDVAVVDEYDPKDSVAKHFEKIEKAAQAMNLIHSAAKIWANAFGRTTDQIKFPSGGVVHQCPPRYGFYKDGLPIDPICVIKSWQPPAPNPYFGQVQVAPLFSKKPTYTRTAEGHLELVDGMDGCEKKYCASKFGVGENVQYGCIKSDIVMIYWNGSEFLYTLKSNSAPDNIRERFLHETVKPSAKFKVGDAVYFKNIGHSLCATENPNKYVVENPSAAGGFVTLKRWDNEAGATCRESDLRLWVETKFSYILGSGVCIIPMSQIDMKSIKYMGKSVVPPANIEYGDDVFLGKTTSGKDIILFGTNGDDIS